jgi:hypothetical protein
MALYLVELQPLKPDRTCVDTLLGRVESAIRSAPGTLVEAHIPVGYRRLFCIVEAPDGEAAGEALLAGDVEFDDIAAVRLVGADLAGVKDMARRQPARYLAEWDLPPGLSMDSYLRRKRDKGPKYAQVPEITFLRTYVREDLAKCICLYDAPDEDAVRRARDAVETPVDRSHHLAPGS